MEIYFSGSGNPHPETLLPGRVSLMLTYHTFHKTEKPDKRFQRMLEDPAVYRKHFLDSGAFSLQKRAKEVDGEFYKSEEFQRYLSGYAYFVKSHCSAIDLCANLDVIGDRTQSWLNLKRLEAAGVAAMPVVHFGADPSTLLAYVQKGYRRVAFGGLVPVIGKPECRAWLERMFAILPCRTEPRVHGFGVNSFRLMRDFPWDSVDSTSWIHYSAYGGVLVPYLRRGRWDMARPPLLVDVSRDNSTRKLRGKHYLTLQPAERKVIGEWLEVNGLKFDRLHDERAERIKANVMYHLRLGEWLTAEPPPPRRYERRGFGL